MVCFIYRDEVYNKETEEKGIAKVINGPIGDFKRVLRNDITKFFNYERIPKFEPV